MGLLLSLGTCGGSVGFWEFSASGSESSGETAGGWKKQRESWEPNDCGHAEAADRQSKLTLCCREGLREGYKTTHANTTAQTKTADTQHK